jgi:UPF0716 protein FxsA
MWIFIALLVIPLIEIRIFALVAGAIGLLPALLLCLLAAIAGTAILRAEGFRTLIAVQGCLIRKEMPVRAVFDGVCRIMAGILLILPGFFSDFLAVLLLTPQVQAQAYRIMGRRFDEQGRPRDPSVIEGDYVRVDREELPPRDSDQT